MTIAIARRFTLSVLLGGLLLGVSPAQAETAPATAPAAVAPVSVPVPDEAAAGRYDMTLVNEVGGLLIAHTAQQVLAEQWSDHGLTADDEWDAGDRDIHLGGDFLLIYRIDPHPEDKALEIIIFKRLGTHSDLFG